VLQHILLKKILKDKSYSQFR